MDIMRIETQASFAVLFLWDSSLRYWNLGKFTFPSEQWRRFLFASLLNQSSPDRPQGPVSSGAQESNQQHCEALVSWAVCLLFPHHIQVMRKSSTKKETHVEVMIFLVFPQNSLLWGFPWLHFWDAPCLLELEFHSLWFSANGTTVVVGNLKMKDPWPPVTFTWSTVLPVLFLMLNNHIHPEAFVLGFYTSALEIE